MARQWPGFRGAGKAPHLAGESLDGKCVKAHAVSKLWISSAVNVSQIGQVLDL